MSNRKEILVLLLIAFMSSVSCVYTPAIKGPGGDELPESIASLESIQLNGVEQWILIRSENRSKPILLFLHGGPGSAEMPMVQSFNPDLEKDFVVVMWDQRGAGKSFSRKIPDSTMNIEQFINDTHELTRILKQRFDREKIYLAGHSWGSLLGMLTIDRFPDDYYAFIGIGQTVNLSDNEEVSWQFCYDEALRREDKKAIKQLEEVGPPVDGVYNGDYKEDAVMLKGVHTERKWLTRYEGWWYGETNHRMIVKALLSADEYSFAESVLFMTASFFSLNLMWPELLDINLEKDVPEVQIPVYFCVGRHDYNTPGEVSYPYFQKLNAPAKDFIWFENSAHSPCYEEPEKFNQLMQKIVAETYPYP